MQQQLAIAVILAVVFVAAVSVAAVSVVAVSLIVLALGLSLLSKLFRFRIGKEPQNRLKPTEKDQLIEIASDFMSILGNIA